jgi:hypothetical protein
MGDHLPSLPFELLKVADARLIGVLAEDQGSDGVESIHLQEAPSRFPDAFRLLNPLL